MFKTMFRSSEWNAHFLEGMYFSGDPFLYLNDEEWLDWDVMYQMGGEL